MEMRNQLFVILLPIFLVAQQVSSTCHGKTSEDGTNNIICANIKSLDEIPTDLYNSSLEFKLFIDNSSLVLTESKAVNNRGIVSLTVTSSNVTLVESSFFEKLENMKKLTIEGSHIGRFESLPRLDKLATIAILRNQIPPLPVNLFHNISSVKEVFIEDNTMLEMKDGSNQELFELQHLPSQFFLNNPTTKLFLSGNGIRTFKPDTFRGLNLLEELTMNRNAIEELPQRAFADLSSLTLLSLMSNKIKRLQGDLFVGLSKLETLVLSNNRLTEVKDDWFIHVPSLKRLILKSNQIATFDLPLKDLLVLVLSGNQLMRLKPGAFERLKSLRELELENTQLSSINHEMFTGLEQLRKLDLSSNNLQELPADVFQNLKLLEVLILNNTGLTTVKLDTFKGLLELTQVYLDNNKLTVLFLSLFNKLKVTVLSLENNKNLSFEPNTFGGKTNIVWLDLENTSVQNLEDVIDDLPMLHGLGVKGTKFENDMRLKFGKTHLFEKNDYGVWERIMVSN